MSSSGQLGGLVFFIVSEEQWLSIIVQGSLQSWHSGSVQPCYIHSNFVRQLKRYTCPKAPCTCQIIKKWKGSL